MYGNTLPPSSPSARPYHRHRERVRVTYMSTRWLTGCSKDRHHSACLWSMALDPGTCVVGYGREASRDKKWLVVAFPVAHEAVTRATGCATQTIPMNMKIDAVKAVVASVFVVQTKHVATRKHGGQRAPLETSWVVQSVHNGQHRVAISHRRCRQIA